MALIANVALNQTQVFNATMPPEGPRVVPFTLDFSVALSYTIDFTLAVQQRRLTRVQCVFVDNSINPAVTTIVVSARSQMVQTLKIPAFSQGFFPTLAPSLPQFVVSTASGVVVALAFVNVPLPSGLWTLSTTTPLAALQAAAFAIVTGGTAVAVFTAAGLRGGGYIVNPITATETLYVDLAFPAGLASPGANGTTVALVAGQAFTIPNNFNGIVSVNAATNGHNFTVVGFN